MEFWFSELHTGNVKLSIKIEKQLFSGESEYQRIDVFDLRNLENLSLWTGRSYSPRRTSLFMTRW